MKTERKPVDHFPVKLWIKANFIGWLLGIILVLILSSTMDAIGIEDLQFFVAIAMGLAIGTVQYRVLKRVWAVSKRWIWHTSIALTIPFVLVDVLRYLDVLNLGDFFIPISVGLASILMGYAQSRLLKIHGIYAKGWIAGSFLSWVLAAASVYIVQFTNQLEFHVSILFVLNCILLLSGGLILGAISAIFLKRLKP